MPQRRFGLITRRSQVTARCARSRSSGVFLSNMWPALPSAGQGPNPAPRLSQSPVLRAMPTVIPFFYVQFQGAKIEPTLFPKGIEGARLRAQRFIDQCFRCDKNIQSPGERSYCQNLREVVGRSSNSSNSFGFRAPPSHTSCRHTCTRRAACGCLAGAFEYVV